MEMDVDPVLSEEVVNNHSGEARRGEIIGDGEKDNQSTSVSTDIKDSNVMQHVETTNEPRSGEEISDGEKEDQSTSVSTDIKDSNIMQNFETNDTQRETRKSSIQQQIIETESPIPIVVSRPKTSQLQLQATSPVESKSVPRDHIGSASPYDTPLTSPSNNIGASPNSRKLRVLYDDMKVRYAALRTKKDAKIDELTARLENNEKLLSLKDAKINELTARLENSELNAKQDVVKMSNEDVFVPKLRRGATGPTKCCQLSGCDKVDVDLIKCNMCEVLCCEDCSGVKINKLRPVMNQCKMLYFVCPGCDILIRDNSNVNAYDAMKGKVEALCEELGNSEKVNEKLTQQVDTLNLHQASLQLLLEERESALHNTEAKLVTIEQSGGTELASIDAKLENFSTNLLTKVTQIVDEKLSKLSPPNSGATYADIARDDTQFVSHRHRQPWQNCCEKIKMKNLWKNRNSNDGRTI